ncbi:hypothetical protein D9758_003217 [Tetrapyrgos nigripes]|uniref:DNA primase large subunit C-terminal domain-containing protein n=1 Tax=Tetrapyrgos nigripes TaxID=182062 RepID=A0A8H5GIF1_9AGAR|nr:hypothetical protein D9758_003217 [Tetrapyrgos nigripes]
MKSFFSRKHDSQAGQTKSASKDFTAWATSEHRTGQSDRRDDSSRYQKYTDTHRSSSRPPRPTQPTPHPVPDPPYSFQTYPSSRNRSSHTRSASANTPASKPMTPAPPPSTRPNPVKLPSTDDPVQTRTSSAARPSTESKRQPAAAHTSSASRYMPGASANASSSHEVWYPQTSTSAPQRLREKEPEREGDKVKPKERDRDREKIREKDKGKDRERDRTWDKERGRERDIDKGRESDREREKERDRERERERGREKEKEKEREREREKRERERERARIRSERDAERADGLAKERLRQREMVLERERLKAQEFKGREKNTSRELDRGKEQDFRSKDRIRYSSDREGERSRRIDGDTRHNEVIRDYVPTQRSSGRDSSDEGDSSDASRHRHGRRNRAKEVIPPITSAYGINSSAPNHFIAPLSQEHALYLGAQSPQPLPVHLPLKFPEPKSHQEVVSSQNHAPPGATAAETKTTKRNQRESETILPQTRKPAEELKTTRNQSVNETQDTSVPAPAKELRAADGQNVHPVVTAPDVNYRSASRADFRRGETTSGKPPIVPALTAGVQDPSSSLLFAPSVRDKSTPGNISQNPVVPEPTHRSASRAEFRRGEPAKPPVVPQSVNLHPDSTSSVPLASTRDRKASGGHSQLPVMPTTIDPTFRSASRADFRRAEPSSATKAPLPQSASGIQEPSSLLFTAPTSRDRTVLGNVSQTSAVDPTYRSASRADFKRDETNLGTRSLAATQASNIPQSLVSTSAPISSGFHSHEESSKAVGSRQDHAFEAVASTSQKIPRDNATKERLNSIPSNHQGKKEAGYSPVGKAFSTLFVKLIEDIQVTATTAPSASKTPVGSSRANPVADLTPQQTFNAHLTPPTPVKRSPSTDHTGQPLTGSLRYNTDRTDRSPVAPHITETHAPRYEALNENNISSDSFTRSNSHPVQASLNPSPEYPQAYPSQRVASNKVPNLVAEYEARSSPNDSLQPTSNQNASNGTTKFPTREDRTTVNYSAGPPKQSSPQFNVSLASNERGRVISISASNEGSPGKSMVAETTPTSYNHGTRKLSEHVGSSPYMSAPIIVGRSLSTDSGTTSLRANVNGVYGTQSPAMPRYSPQSRRMDNNPPTEALLSASDRPGTTVTSNNPYPSVYSSLAQNSLHNQQNWSSHSPASHLGMAKPYGMSSASAQALPANIQQPVQGSSATSSAKPYVAPSTPSWTVPQQPELMNNLTNITKPHSGVSSASAQAQGAFHSTSAPQRTGQVNTGAVLPKAYPGTTSASAQAHLPSAFNQTTQSNADTSLTKPYTGTSSASAQAYSRDPVTSIPSSRHAGEPSSRERSNRTPSFSATSTTLLRHPKLAELLSDEPQRQTPLPAHTGVASLEDRQAASGTNLPQHYPGQSSLQPSLVSHSVSAVAKTPSGSMDNQAPGEISNLSTNPPNHFTSPASRYSPPKVTASMNAFRRQQYDSGQKEQPYPGVTNSVSRSHSDSQQPSFHVSSSLPASLPSNAGFQRSGSNSNTFESSLSQQELPLSQQSGPHIERSPSTRPADPYRQAETRQTSTAAPLSTNSRLPPERPPSTRPADPYRQGESQQTYTAAPWSINGRTPPERPASTRPADPYRQAESQQTHTAGSFANNSRIPPDRPPSTRPVDTYRQGESLNGRVRNGQARTRDSRQGPSTHKQRPSPPSSREQSSLPAYIQPSQSQSTTPSSSHSQSLQNHGTFAHHSREPSTETVLQTPSPSLAAPALKPNGSQTSIPTSTASQQESRKKGLFGIFKSKTAQSQAPQYETWEPPKPPPPTTPVSLDVPSRHRHAQPDMARKRLSSRAKIPPPINVPIPTLATASGGRKSPSKVFTPFRYLSVKRNRTVSAASVEAVNGTAPNTVVGSPTASMHSSQPPIQPPPLRDPRLATHEWQQHRFETEWRNGGGHHKVLRPGVVFDVPQEPSEDKQNLKYVKTRLRAGQSSRYYVYLLYLLYGVELTSIYWSTGLTRQLPNHHRAMYKGAQQKPKFSDEHSEVTHHVSLQYPNRLNFYDKPPLYDVTIEEFETCALNRLRILAEIESSAARNRSWEETKKVTLAQAAKYLPSTDNPSSDQNNLAVERRIMLERKRDHLSHFVLRLAFCRSAELRRRFIQAESTLFRVHYDDTKSAERRNFLNSRDFNWVPAENAEKEEYEEELSVLLNQGDPMKRIDPKNENFYKVSWTRVPDLVDKRKVFLKKGWAYVHGNELSSIIFQEFEVQLGKALELTARALPRLDEDNRLIPILDNLCQGFLAGVPTDWVSSTPGSTDGEITADMIDDLAKQHFPLCMKNMHQSLRKEHHLKHFERLNYGLFLKARLTYSFVDGHTMTHLLSQILGLSIDEAIAFWRKSFMGGKAQDKFDKEYKYNIRHSYGLEGRRANYPAKRYFTPENLQTALLSAYSAQGLKSSDLPEIMQIVKLNHFHVACTRVFEITHSRYAVKKGEGVGGGESVTHPNQYAARSMELDKAAQESVKSETGMVVD